MIAIVLTIKLSKDFFTDIINLVCSSIEYYRICRKSIFKTVNFTNKMENNINDTAVDF